VFTGNITEPQLAVDGCLHLQRVRLWSISLTYAYPPFPHPTDDSRAMCSWWFVLCFAWGVMGPAIGRAGSCFPKNRKPRLRRNEDPPEPEPERSFRVISTRPANTPPFDLNAAEDQEEKVKRTISVESEATCVQVCEGCVGLGEKDETGCEFCGKKSMEDVSIV
jgi:hypothetical protein